MTTLIQKIKELEAKHKEQLNAEKAKLMAKYRGEQKKQKEAEEKLFLARVAKYRKHISDDTVFFGCLQNGVNAITTNDEKSKQKLDFFRGLVQPKEKSNP